MRAVIASISKASRNCFACTTPSQYPKQHLGRRVAQLGTARMNEICAALRFSLGCNSN